MVQYDRHQQVQAGPPSERVRLRLQTRHLEGVDPFHCVCWRTCYPGTSSNRRFYMTDGAPWVTRATTALALLAAADHAGMLAPELDDAFQRWGGGVAHHLSSLDLRGCAASSASDRAAAYRAEVTAHPAGAGEREAAPSGQRHAWRRTPSTPASQP